MAKKQTLESKLNKRVSTKKSTIKLIRSIVSEKTGSIRFTEDLIGVPEGKSPENAIKEFLQAK